MGPVIRGSVMINFWRWKYFLDEGILWLGASYILPTYHTKVTPEVYTKIKIRSNWRLSWTISYYLCCTTSPANESCCISRHKHEPNKIEVSSMNVIDLWASSNIFELYFWNSGLYYYFLLFIYYKVWASTHRILLLTRRFDNASTMSIIVVENSPKFS